MCLDLRNSYIKNIDELEFIITYNKNITMENIKEIAFNKELYQEAKEKANESLEVELLL